MSQPKTLALLGLGLVGGSLAAAWRRHGLVDVVHGFDPNAQHAQQAQQRGIVDQLAHSAAEAVQGADVIVLAAPVGAMAALMQEIAPALAPAAIVTDVGSCKQSVIEAARQALGGAFTRFVPAHPIAGGETTGPQRADAALFNNKLLISTPLPETDAAALAWVESAWRAIGARVERMDAQTHDRVFAAVSHLPHLLAFALVAQIAAQADGDQTLSFAGSGFRDFSRIAASSAVMWRDVCLANRVALSEELRGYRALLDQLQAAVDNSDAQLLQKTFEQASQARRKHARTLDGE